MGLVDYNDRSEFLALRKCRSQLWLPPIPITPLVARRNFHTSGNVYLWMNHDILIHSNESAYVTREYHLRQVVAVVVALVII